MSAWISYDRAAIEVLFSDEATYRYSPYDEPVKGRDNIVADWLAEADSPNTFSAEYHAIAVDGNTAVANGRTVYYEADGKTVENEFDNIFVLRFDDEGRCADFCEWFMKRRTH
jgi:hypothetical protein